MDICAGKRFEVNVYLGVNSSANIYFGFDNICIVQNHNEKGMDMSHDSIC